LEGKPINGAATAQFVDGVRDILAVKLERFNQKFQKREAEIRGALYKPLRILLVTAHTSTQPFATPAQQKIQDLIDELNVSGPIATSEYFDQARLYKAITSDSEGAKIKLEIPIRDWGVIDKPFQAFYGRVHVLEVAKWWHDYNRSLCTRNLRHLLPSSEVNAALEKTLKAEADNFWYFNNGITIVCDSIDKAIYGAPKRDVGLFKCEGVSIVNGAQTVGTIGTTLSDSKTAEDQPGWIQVRIISLDKAPPDFDRRITRATNFQNAVRGRDFAAMDPTQQRLATEFALDRQTYAYKSGESDPQGEQGCSITEATQALACAQDAVDLAVQVKREIGSIWANIDEPPYTDLFNDSLTSQKVWRSVLVMRMVDSTLQTLRGSNLQRADMIGIHMNRVILHLVFQDSKVKPLNHDEADLEQLLREVQQATERVFEEVASYLQTTHPGEYLASLCKNRPKCAALSDAIKANLSVPRGQSGSLFENPKN
jgi:AIPR protein